jgi:hypothetical protein
VPALLLSLSLLTLANSLANPVYNVSPSSGIHFGQNGTNPLWWPSLDCIFTVSKKKQRNINRKKIYKEMQKEIRKRYSRGLVTPAASMLTNKSSVSQIVVNIFLIFGMPLACHWNSEFPMP